MRDDEDSIIQQNPSKILVTVLHKLHLPVTPDITATRPRSQEIFDRSNAIDTTMYRFN